MYYELSYRLSTNTPLAPGVPPLTVRHHSSLDRGDTSNLFVLEFSNHVGTHIDAPWHFVPTGLRLTDFRLDEFVFEKVFCLDLPLHEGELLRPAHFEPFMRKISRCDLLLIRTGFAAVRRTDPERYRLYSPGMSVEGARYLAERYSKLRALGLDTISLASMQHLDQGLEAHRILLGGAHRRFLIIEDMKLDSDALHVSRVIALPLFIDGVDGSPCTILGIAD